MRNRGGANVGSPSTNLRRKKEGKGGGKRKKKSRASFGAQPCIRH